MSVPTDDAGWKRLIRSAQPPGWGFIAKNSGGSTWKADGAFAAIVPAAPERSIFNSVFYSDGEALLSHLDEIAAAYEEAGVRAWTVWVPEDDAEVADALQGAGHLDDAQPREMAMPLSDLREPGPDPELEIVEREDYATLARLNEVAYGWPAGAFAVVEQATDPDSRMYFGRLEGEDVATLAIGRLGSDAIVAWVAVLPEARGRGASGRVLAQALSDARDSGLETTTLQATKLGAPVYSKLGYRDFGAMHMWERRAR